MSGGSYNYLYQNVRDMADELCGQKPALRRAFGKHLKLVAQAMHDIEWVDSADYGKGDEEKAIRAALKDIDARVMEIVTEDAKTVLKELTEALTPSPEEPK